MPYNATVYKVMIASPNDVAHERSIIRDVLNEWNTVNSDSRKIVLLPIGWETHTSPEMGENPQEIINKQIAKDCDLLVGVFWTRIGTPTQSYLSGTVEEIEEHIAKDKPTMLYFSSAPIHPDIVDQSQYNELKKFKEACSTRGIYETYSDLSEFKSKFYRQLQIKLNKDKFFTTNNQGETRPFELVESKPVEIPHLSEEAKVLLVETANDSHGHILRLHHLGGVTIQTGSKTFVNDSNPRNRATWEGAIKELEENGLIEPLNPKREIFQITRRGYDIAELLG